MLLRNAISMALVCMPVLASCGSGPDGGSGTDASGAQGDASPVADAGIADARPEITYKGTIKDVRVGRWHACALLEAGTVRCWGQNMYGQLGYGHTEPILVDDLPFEAGDVDVGGTVTQIAAGNFHTCALLDTQRVRCWGHNTRGQLGYGHTELIGDNEVPSVAGDVDVGGNVIQVETCASTSCALLDTGAVRCWGDGFLGQLGNATEVMVSDPPNLLEDIDLGGLAVQIAAGGAHICALLDTGAVRCWGSGHEGALGYGTNEHVGDDELPSSMGDVDVGGESPVLQLTAGDRTTCALLENGAVRCWGEKSALGLGGIHSIGDDELPSSVDDVDVGGVVTQVITGGEGGDQQITCAVLDSGAMRCWGEGWHGYGPGPGNHSLNPPSSFGDLDLGYPVRRVDVGGRNTCVLLERGSVRCWGAGGMLATGTYEDIGILESVSVAIDACIEGFEESCP